MGSAEAKPSASSPPDPALANNQPAIDDLFAFAQQQAETPAPAAPAPTRAFTPQESDDFFPPTDKKAAASEKAATAIITHLREGQAFDWKQLFAITDEAFGGTQADGTYTVKDAYDALELGLNRFIRADFLQDGTLTGPGTLIKTRGAVMQLKKLLTLVPTQTKRTAEMDEFQQFSTVPPLAFMANWAANLRPGDVYLGRVRASAAWPSSARSPGPKSTSTNSPTAAGIS